MRLESVLREGKMRALRFCLVITLLGFASQHAALAQAAKHSAHENLGVVKFKTSCSGVAQPQFNRAVALMHSFQFARAIEGFKETLASDPSCAIAYWGIALSDWGNPFGTGQRPAAQLEQGLSAVEQGRSGQAKTERERAYIEAVAPLYADVAKIDQRSRVLAYESAMANVSAAYPED